MPQIAPGQWKMALHYTWYRIYEDGRIEHEIDEATGAMIPWGVKTPEGLTRVGWKPVSPSMAQVMRRIGEYGIPCNGQEFFKNIKPGQEPIIFRENTVYDGHKVTCKVCGATYLSKVSPRTCPKCQAEVAWRCTKCNKLSDKPLCKCGRHLEHRKVSPFEVQPYQWEVGEYTLGVKGEQLMRFTSTTATIVTE